MYTRTLHDALPISIASTGRGTGFGIRRDAWAGGFYRFGCVGGGAFGRLEKTTGDCGSAGAAAGYPAAGRTDEPSGLRGNWLVGGRAAKRGICMRGGEP